MAFSLEAIFGVDATGVRATMKSLRNDVNNFVNEWGKIGAGMAVGAFVALSKGAIDLAGRLSDTSQNIGINVESLQALEAQHKRNGVPAETLTKTLEKLRLGVEKAREGDEKSNAALQKLGLTWQQLSALPLEKKYEAVARGLKSAEDKAGAYNAVSELFGDKIGPKLMGSLNELATEGFAKVMKSAQEAGQVMSAETVAALDKAGDAIDDFKKQATIAVGNIIVNFRSEEGLKLLGMQFLKVVGLFGAGIVDAVVEGGQIVWSVLKGAFIGVTNYLRDGMIDAVKYIALGINQYLPAKWQINIAGIESLKSTGEGVADSIARAIAQTTPSTFKKDVAAYWDKAIHDQQLVVTALNKVDFGKEATKLRDSGKAIESSLAAGADVLVDAGKQVATDLRQSAQDAWKNLVAAGKAIGVDRVGTPYQDQSTTALEGVAERLRQQLAEAKRNPSTDSLVQAIQTGPIQAELNNAQRELDQRRAVLDFYQRNGQTATVSQFGDDLTNRALRDLQDSSTRQTTAIESIDERLKRLFPIG